MKKYYTIHRKEWLIENNIIEIEELKKLDPYIKKLKETKYYIFEETYSQLKTNSKKNKINYSNTFASRYYGINSDIRNLKNKLNKKLTHQEILKMLKNQNAIYQEIEPTQTKLF